VQAIFDHAATALVATIIFAAGLLGSVSRMLLNDRAVATGMLPGAVNVLDG
jgi:hypothetical protein